ncbi:MAG: hypothetical protein ACPG4T_04720 [Nannocystaceae bacterium]
MSRKRTSNSGSVRLPSADELGLPPGAQRLYTRLSLEPVGDFGELVRACKQHVHAFEVQARVNELLPIEHAQQLAQVIETLIDRAHQAGPLARGLAWVVGRYFVIADDGDPDFSVIGLDDDIALCNAICAHLGHTDLHVEL